MHARLHITLYLVDKVEAAVGTLVAGQQVDSLPVAGLLLLGGSPPGAGLGGRHHQASGMEEEGRLHLRVGAYHQQEALAV